MMRNKEIKNLADLRRAKRELKLKIDKVENQTGNSFWANAAKTFTNSIENSFFNQYITCWFTSQFYP